MNRPPSVPPAPTAGDLAGGGPGSGAGDERCPYTGAAAAPAPPGRHAARRPAVPALYGPRFHADPHAVYRDLRAMGPIAPVELSPGLNAMITTTYEAALHLLRHTPGTFRKDPQYWVALREGRVPEDSPALPMIMPRDNALWKDGLEHTRLRGAITASLARVDTHGLPALVEAIADALIDSFAADGTADLVAQYAAPLPMQVLLHMFGCPEDLGFTIVDAIARLFDTVSDAARANAELEAACLELARLKRAEPGDDVTSWMIAQPQRLTDAEMIQQILLVVGAGTTPSTNLIANTLHRLITDDEYAGDAYTGSRPITGVVERVLWEDPPVANYCPLYATTAIPYGGITIPPGVPVLVSFAMANTDPALDGMRREDNRGHLAFSGGIRACPAQGLARLITQTAVTRLLDRLPDAEPVDPDAPASRRPPTFHSGLTTLPVAFTPPRATPSPSHDPGSTLE
ncbi:cytochrome P450 [Streptomyces alkaliphilus]|uniref:cytochrome P450 n=1 Tax=Streptomyces alkaliphilus TaxID=1472722 RepID=UPI0011804182|nr:cytochrome P450 [Streptomyces alkaliphilus]MQS06403.1 cytochrome P450 [Streptomyces alkaliphilus]